VAFCLVPVTGAGQHSAGDQAMHVNMTTQVLTPSVDSRRHAQLASKVPGVTPKLAERIPRRGEQAAIDHLRMDLSPAAQGVGQIREVFSGFQKYLYLENLDGDAL